MNLGIRDKRALVCGASSGLGFAVAEALRAEGCAVVMNARDARNLEAAASRIGAETAAGNVTMDAAGIVQRAGDIDILVCNAGGPPAGHFDSFEPSAWQKALDLNLLSTVKLVHAALPGMRERLWGRIICITSLTALEAEPNLLLSTMTRAGVHGFAKALSDEVAADGVTVNCVAPGLFGTDRLHDLYDRDQLTAARQRIPARRLGEPAELGAVVAFLASEKARYITGTVVRVDGGITRSIS